jgi:hypothetical protein
MFSTKLESKKAEQILLGSEAAGCWGVGGWGENVAQTMYTRMNKCEDNKIIFIEK